jgi:hypothetical protein
MNKYLSYEKSRKLAELGYKPEEGWNWYEIRFNRLDESEWTEIVCSCEGFVYQYGQPYTVLCAAPDCHDLLMELQKYSDGDIELRFYNSQDPDNLGIMPCRFILSYYRMFNTEDPNPVEALGAALIKLLEEKQ